MSVRVCTRILASRLESGSSMQNTCGLRTIARPIATRWRWPPERAFGLRSRNSVSPSILAASLTRSRRSASGTLAIFRAKAMLSATDMWG